MRRKLQSVRIIAGMIFVAMTILVGCKNERLTNLNSSGEQVEVIDEISEEVNETPMVFEKLIEFTRAAIYGDSGTDNQFYFIDEKGVLSSIEGNYRRGAWIASKNLYVVLSKEWDLIVMDENQNNQIVIAKDIHDWSHVSDGGIVYSISEPLDYEEILVLIESESSGAYDVQFLKELVAELEYEENSRTAEILYYYFFEELLEVEETYYRYAFDLEESIELGTGSYAVAEDSLNLAYEKDGVVYFLEESADEPQQLKVHSDSVELIAVSTEGIVLWSCETESEDIIYAYVDDEIERIGSYDSAKATIYDEYEAMFDNDGGFVVKGRVNKVFVKHQGVDVNSVQIGNGTLTFLQFAKSAGWTASREYGHYKVNSLDSFYVLEVPGNTDGWTVYQIDKNGDKFRIVSGVRADLEISNDIIYYRDMDNNFYSRAIEGVTIGDKNKISSDVHKFYMTDDGQCVYYLKNYDSEKQKGDLYYAEYGQDSVRIATEVYENFFIFEERDYVGYFQDVEEFGDEDVYGALYMYCVGGESKKVDTDVIVTRANIQYKSINSFNYRKYIGTEDDNEIYDAYYYSNGEKEKLAANLIF